MSTIRDRITEFKAGIIGSDLIELGVRNLDEAEISVYKSLLKNLYPKIILLKSPENVFKEFLATERRTNYDLFGDSSNINRVLEDKEFKVYECVCEFAKTRWNQATIKNFMQELQKDSYEYKLILKAIEIRNLIEDDNGYSVSDLNSKRREFIGLASDKSEPLFIALFQKLITRDDLQVQNSLLKKAVGNLSTELKSLSSVDIEEGTIEERLKKYLSDEYIRCYAILNHLASPYSSAGGVMASRAASTLLSTIAHVPVGPLAVGGYQVTYNAFVLKPFLKTIYFVFDEINQDPSRLALADKVLTNVAKGLVSSLQDSLLNDLVEIDERQKDQDSSSLLSVQQSGSVDIDKKAKKIIESIAKAIKDRINTKEAVKQSSRAAISGVASSISSGLGLKKPLVLEAEIDLSSRTNIDEIAMKFPDEFFQNLYKSTEIAFEELQISDKVDKATQRFIAIISALDIKFFDKGKLASLKSSSMYNSSDSSKSYPSPSSSVSSTSYYRPLSSLDSLVRSNS